MEGTLVLPDTSTAITPAEIRSKKTEVDKVYNPFMSKFLGDNGVITNTLTSIKDILNLRFLGFEDMLDEQLVNQEKERKARERLEPTKDEQSRDKKAKKKWYQVLFKNKFFDSALGFLKSMATTSFLSEILALFIMLRMGLLQPVIKMVANMIGGIIKSLIEMTPAILKFIWHILWEFMPKVLGSVFDAILKTFGIENEFAKKISGLVAKFLPLIVAITVIATKLWAIGTAIASAVAGIALIPVLIIAGLIALGIAIWYFWDDIIKGLSYVWEKIKEGIAWIGNMFSNLWSGITSGFMTILDFYLSIPSLIEEKFYQFINWLGSAWDKLLYETLPEVWEGIQEMFFKILKAFLWPIRRLFSMLSRLFSPIINGITSMMKMLKPLFDGVEKILQPIKDFFSMLNRFIKNTTDMITSVFRDTMGPIFEWIENIATYGLSWFRMDEKEKQGIQEAQKISRQSGDQGDILNRYVTAEKQSDRDEILKEIEGTQAQARFKREADKIRANKKKDESASQYIGRTGKVAQFENILDFKVSGKTVRGS